MRNLLKKSVIIGVSGLCAFTPVNAGQSAASIQNVKVNVAGTETRQANKTYKYKQDKKQVKEFNSIKTDFNSLDMVIKESGDKNFYVSYNLNCRNSSNPLSYKVEDGILSIKESGLEWPAGYVYIYNKDKKTKKINYKNYTNKVYVYIPSGTKLKNCNLDTRTSDLFIKDISMENGNIITQSGDIDITVPGITGIMDIKAGSGDIDINTDRDTKIKTNITGQLNINTGSGDIDIKKSVINKTFNIKTGSGDVCIRGSVINKTSSIRTGSGDVEIGDSSVKDKLGIQAGSGDIEADGLNISGTTDIKTDTGDIEAENLNISGTTNIKTGNGDVDIKLNNRYTDKLGIKMVTKDGDMYIKKIYKGSKKEKGDGYEYTRNVNRNKEPFLNVLVTGCGDIGLR